MWSKMIRLEYAYSLFSSFLGCNCLETPSEYYILEQNKTHITMRTRKDVTRLIHSLWDEVQRGAGAFIKQRDKLSVQVYRHH